MIKLTKHEMEDRKFQITFRRQYTKMRNELTYDIYNIVSMPCYGKTAVKTVYDWEYERRFNLGFGPHSRPSELANGNINGQPFKVFGFSTQSDLPVDARQQAQVYVELQ